MALQEREKTIEDGLQKAAQAEKKALEMQSTMLKQEVEAKAKAKEIVQIAEQSAKKSEQEILDTAKLEAKRILDAAKENAVKEVELVQEELKNLILSSAADIAKQAVNKEIQVDPTLANQVVTDYIHKIKS